MTPKLSCRHLVRLVGLLLVAMTFGNEVTGQFTGTTGFQTAPSMATRSQFVPMNSDDMLLSGSKAISSDDDSTRDDKKKKGGKSSRDDDSERSAEDESGDESDSGSRNVDFGSSRSKSLEYECDCRMVRRVSLMGASDYCLAPNAPLSSKCGNVDLGETGACPIMGAQPCSPKGHVLANDSLCLLDEKDDTYKCVASKNDLEIQKYGKKKKRKSNRPQGSEIGMNGASSHFILSARQALAVVVCVAAGVMAVV